MINQNSNLEEMNTDARLRELLQQNAQRGARLARLEFQSLLNELASGVLAKNHDFDLPSFEIADPSDAWTRPDFTGLPVPDAVDVPLGSIAYSSEMKDLPTIGIYCPAGAALANGLPKLLLDLNKRAFARLVFICQSIDIIPFLGRCGFCTMAQLEAPIEESFIWASKKFDVSEVRSALTAELLWQRQ
ncbi:MAG: hypothetical protein JXQ97_15650 [Natronospirillum sp.]